MRRSLPGLLLLCFLFPRAALQAQVTVNDGTRLTILAGTAVSLGGDILLQPGSALEQHGTLRFKGNFTHHGTAQFHSGSRLVAGGTSRQWLGGTEQYALPHLTLANPAGLTVATPVSITDSLVLTEGILYSTAAAPVRFVPTAAPPTETAGSYISGYALMEERAVGEDALAPFLGFALSPGEDVGRLQLTRVSGPGGIVTAVVPKTSIAAHWQVQATKQPAAYSRTTTFAWQPVLDNDVNMQSVDLYAAGASGVYRKLNSDSVNLSALTPRSFTTTLDTLARTYTLSSSVPNLQFLTLAGRLVTAGTELEWTTGREVNNRGFDIERSLDGTRFSTIAFEEGKNGAPLNQYAYTDRETHKLKARSAYYRLRQWDIYGNYQYSNTVVVSLDNSTLYRFVAYPVPFNRELKIDIHKEDADGLTVQLVAASGAKVYEQRYHIGRKGTIHLKGLSGLAAGVYYLRVVNDHVDDTIPVLKSNN